LRNYWNVFASSALLEISKSRQGSYKTAWKKMADIAGMKTNELTIGTLQAVVKKEAPTYYPAKDMKTVLTALFEMAVAEHNAWANLGNFIVLPKLDEKVPEPFTQEELYTIWEAYGNGETFCGYLLLMIYTGMMPGELLKLRPEMISWDTNEIIGDGLKNDIRKKQPIVFPEIIVPVMEDLLTRTSPKTGRVVPIGKDKFYKLYHATTEKIGIRDLKPYSCRHTTATALALGDTVLAPSVIQAVMRHSKFSTTQRYIHPDSTSKVAAVNTMGKGKAPGEVPTTPDSSN
jgi:integrase